MGERLSLSALGPAARLGVLALARAGMTGLGAVSLLVIARLLDPAALGVWGMALAVQGWALHIGEFGLRSVVTTEAARRPEAFGTLLRRYLGLRLALSLAVVAAVCLGGLVLVGERVVLIGTLTLAILAAALQLDWVPLVRRQEAIAAALLLARPAAFLVLVFAVRPADPSGLAAVWLAAWALAAAASWLPLGRVASGGAPTSGAMLRRGARLCLVTCLNQAQIGLDLIVLGAVLGSAAAGDYWLVSQIAVAALALANAANQQGLARFARLEGDARDRALGRALVTISAAGLALAGTLMIVAPFAPIALGAEHAGVVRLLPWMLPWLVLQHPNAVLLAALIAERRESSVVGATVAGALVLVLGLGCAAAIGSVEAFAAARVAAEAARLGWMLLAVRDVARGQPAHRR